MTVTDGAGAGAAATRPQGGAAPRSASIRRDTKETSVSVSVDMDGTGDTEVSTGVGFIDHLVTSFGKHGMMDLRVAARSNDGITHHLIEDTAIAIGQAVDGALGPRTGITRFGHASVPMDESLAEATVDLVRRPFWRSALLVKRDMIEGVPREDLEHFVQSLLQNLNACIHLTVRYGDNDHHKVEAAVKSLAVALRAASAADARQGGDGVPSTKGSM